MRDALRSAGLLLFLPLALAAQEPHRTLSVEELAAASPFSGTARVERVGVRSDPATGAVYTDAHLRVFETWAGPFPPEVVLTQVGGALDGRRSAAVGWNYSLAPGATIAFFAKHWKGPYFAVTGMRQGLYHLDGPRAIREMDRSRPEAQALTLEELRARAGRALGREIEAPTSPADEPVAPRVPAPEIPPAPESAGRAFFALAALLGLAALLVRIVRKR